MSVKTGGMIAAFKVTVNIPNISQSFPTEESPGNFSASDSILLSLVRRDEPGLSSLFPLLAASIVDSLLSGAASSLAVTR